MRASALQGRIVWRAGLVMAAVLALPLIVLIIVVQTNARHDLNQSTEQALASLTVGMERMLDGPVSDIEALANRSTMRSYASQLVAVPINEFTREDGDTLIANMLSDFDDLLSGHRGLYLSVRYITREGRTFGEAFSIGNETQFITQPRQFDMTDDSTYLTALGAQRESRAFFSPVTFDAEGRPDMVTLYAPVLPNQSAIEPVGVVQLVVHMETLQNFARTALDNPLVAAPDRRVLLLDAASNILADTNPGAESEALALLTTNIGAFTLTGTADGGLASVRVLDGYNGLDMPWRIAIVDSSNPLMQRANQQTLLFLIGYGVVIAIGLATLQISLTVITRPLADAVQRVQSLASGADPQAQPAHVTGTGDEIDGLFSSIGGISQRLSQMNETLEMQTQRRRRDLELTSRIGREVASLHEIDTLMKRAINLICDEFGYYHAQIFLVDDAGINAVLVHSRGRAGEKLLAQNFKIPVGSETVIGTVTAQGRPVIVDDTARRGRAPHAINPVLAETRAEMGLPLLVGDQVMGVLDVQSKEPDAFHEDDLPVFTLLADQLAVAIHNTRLVAQAERRVQQIDTLNRQLTRSAWEQASERIQLSGGYRYNLLDVEADSSPAGDMPDALQAPISIRNESVGTLSVQPAEDQEFTDGDRMVLQAVASRVALAIENARLFQETQASLAETSTLYGLSRLMNEANTLDDIIHAIIDGLMPDASGGQVWLFDESFISIQDAQWMEIAADLGLGRRPSVPEATWPERRLTLAGTRFAQHISEETVTLITDIEQDARLQDDPAIRAAFREIEARALVIVPLKGLWHGLLTIEFAAPRQFQERDGRIYMALIDQASVAVDNRLLMRQTEEEVARNENLYAASRIINTAQTLNELIYAAVATTPSIDLDYALSLLEGEPDEHGWPTRARMVARSLHGQIEEMDMVYAPEFAPDSPIYEREPEILVDDDPENEDVKPAIRWLRAHGFRFSAMFPLFSVNQPIALFHVFSTQPHSQLDNTDYEMYRAITGQMSGQIQIRRLLESTESALDETRRLYVASRAIVAAPDMEAICDASIKYLKQPFENVTEQMIRVTLLLAHPDPVPDVAYLDAVRAWSNTPEMTDLGRFERESLPYGRLTTKVDRALHISSPDDYERDPILRAEPDLGQRLAEGDIQSMVLVPVRSRGNWFGVIVCQSAVPYAFSEQYVRFVSALSDQVAIAIDNQRLFGQIQSSLEETSTLYQASRALSDATSPADVLDVVVGYLIQPHVDRALIGLLQGGSWDDPAASVEIVASWSEDGDTGLNGLVLNREVFPAWDRLASTRPLLLDDIQNAPDLEKAEAAALNELDARALAIIPLRVPARSIGFIWISSHEPYAHQHERDMRTYQAFAEQASLTLEASYLLEQTERRARQLQTSAEVSRRAGTLLDLEALMTQVVELIKESFSYDHAQIFLMDERDEYAVLRASTGEPGRLLLATNHKLAKGSDSIIGMVMARAEVQVALDTEAADVIHKPNPFLPQTRSELALPLIIKGRVIGALDVQSNQPNAFSEQDIAALNTLAAQIAVAIDNARLYQDSQEQAANMGFLFDVTTAAAAADTLEETLHNVAANLYNALDALSVTIYVPQLYVDDFGNTRATMMPMALAGVDQPLSELEEVNLDADDRLVGLVATQKEALLVSNVTSEGRYLPVASQAKSAALLPLISSGEVIGLIVIENARARAFDADDLQLFKTMAGSLSAIVQSALLLDQLTRTNEQLRELDRLKSDFLANMSHELRTPLNSIIGFSRVMLKGIDGPLTEMQEQDLTTIYNSGQHLLMLINDVLDQAKIAAGKMDLKFDYFDVKPLIEGVKSIGVGLVKDKPINLLVELAPNLPRAYGDEFRTRQVLLNLVSNAAKFTNEGSITMRVYPVTDETTGKQMVRMDVIDTGTGIAEEEMPLLFEAFRQIDSSLTRTHGGTGLGLPIARSLVEMQGGEMFVSSQVNVGSIFSITVPIEETVPAAESDDDSASSSNGASGNGLDPDTQPVMKRPRAAESPLPAMPAMPTMPEKRDVLLIEDNKDMVDQFRRALQREGFEVQTADHPAYTEAMASNLRPSVIVMDVNFADGEGWSILERLKQRDDTFDIPIVVVSLSAEADRALELGAHAFVQRPFMPEDLLKAVLDAEQEGRTDRILIIDDQDESVRLLTELLAENGKYRVFSACNGKEGVSLVARRRPDLIILDLRMPEMDGFAVLNELRAQPETAAIPVMIVTGEIDLSQDEMAQLDNVRVLPKTDISSDQFEQFVREVRDHLNGG